VGLVAEQRVQKRFTCGLVAAAPGLDRYEDSVDLGQLLGIVEPHHPAAVGFVVHVKDTQIHRRSRLSLRGFTLAPDLEGAGVYDSGLPVEIERVENERLSLGIEHTAKRFLGAAAAI